jgi:hypothetical protein
MRLLQVFNPKRDPQEQAATSHLLSNTDLMPQHMREQFLNSQLPASNFVRRLRNLADVNPDFQKQAKPLLDEIQGFFQPKLSPKAPRNAAKSVTEPGKIRIKKDRHALKTVTDFPDPGMIDQLRELAAAEPFQPFTIVLCTGHEYDVEHAADIEFTPYGSLKVRDMDERWRFLNVDAIDEIILL